MKRMFASVRSSPTAKSMRFLIEDGKPYLCSGGRVYPVEISDGKVKIDLEEGVLSDQRGRYCLQEVISKLGNNSSSVKRRKRKPQEV